MVIQKAYPLVTATVTAVTIFLGLFIDENVLRNGLLHSNFKP
jgi:hypothetical protein